MKTLNHVFTLNPADPSGEQVILHTKFEDISDSAQEGEDLLNIEQELILNSGIHSAHFNIGFLLNPSTLRELANTIESYKKKALYSINR